MRDRPLNADRGLKSPCLQLLPALSLATLILGVAQSAQANDGAITFELAQAPDSPSEAVLPAESQSQVGESTLRSGQQGVVPAHSAALTFDLPAIAPQKPDSPPPAVQREVADSTNLEIQFSRADLFVGGSRSLVAKAVGAAEGTRTPDGHKTPAYYGHVDPGNRAWNLGSFSYQHGAASPEEADRKQLARLASQAEALRQQAQAQGVELTLEEELNGIDLANQAPLAALDRGGYIDRLLQARKLGLKGSEAVTWARAQSFFDPRTGRLNAPGLGNRIDWVLQDQERRRAAVARAIALHQPTANPTVEALIQADTGKLLAQTTPVQASELVAAAPPPSTVPEKTASQEPQDLTFQPSRFDTLLAQSQPDLQDEVPPQRTAQPTQVEEPAPQPVAPAESPNPRKITSWGGQPDRPALEPGESVLTRLSAQASRVRSSLRSLDRMRSLLPVLPTPEPPQEQSARPPEPPTLTPPAPGPTDSERPQTRVQQLVQQSSRPANPAPELLPVPAPVPEPAASSGDSSQADLQSAQPQAEVTEKLIGLDLSPLPLPDAEEIAP